MEVPGVKDGDDLSNGKHKKQCLQAIGRRMALCFKSGDCLVVENIKCSRQVEYDYDERHDIKLYCFETISAPICDYTAIIAATNETLAATNATILSQHL